MGNVFLGMQLAMSSYLQVCFCATNDVVMSVSLMFEKPESGTSDPALIYFACSDSAHLCE